MPHIAGGDGYTFGHGGKRLIVERAWSDSTLQQHAGSRIPHHLALTSTPRDGYHSDVAASQESGDSAVESTAHTQPGYHSGR